MTETSPSRLTFGKNFRIGITFIGGLLIVAGLLVDVVMNNLSSGIGPLQMAVMVFGLLLMIFPWIPFSAAGRGLVSLIAIIVMIILLEILLAFAGFQPEWNAPANFDANETLELEINPIRVCDDERGCHWNVAYQRNRCADDSQGRQCRLNDYGMTSEVEFTADSLGDNQYRILVLGDSFTWGASSDFGQGWVDVMTRGLQTEQDVLVWNTAMPGTGTAQAIITAQNLIPIMQPDLVILGFHTGNDFADNLYPYDRFINIVGENDTQGPVQQYSLDAAGNPFRETDAVLFYRASGYTVSSIDSWQTAVTAMLRKTRLGTLLVGAYRVITWNDTNIPPTEALVTELETFVIDSGSSFVLVIIPEETDAKQPTQKYQAGLTVVENTGVDFVDTLPLLDVADFQNPNSGDKHLNNQGHAIVGELMTRCVSHFIETSTFDCQ